MTDYINCLTEYVGMVTPYAIVWGLGMAMCRLFVKAVTGGGKYD